MSANETMPFILAHEESGWQAEFEVDLEAAKEPCLECLNSFGDPITRADESTEEIVAAYLKLCGPELINISTHKACANGDPAHVIGAMLRVQGFYPLDGSKGVKLVYCDTFNFSCDDFAVGKGKAR